MKQYFCIITCILATITQAGSEPSSNQIAPARQLAGISKDELYQEFTTTISIEQPDMVQFLDIIQDETKAFIPVIESKMTDLLANEFSEKDLRVLIKVQSHPTVKRFDLPAPKFKSQLQQAFSEYVRDHPEIRKRMVDRIMKRQKNNIHKGKSNQHTPKGEILQNNEPILTEEK